MKRTYQAPMASVETFGATDSYCAACFTLACDVNAANEVEMQNGTYAENPTGTQVNHSAAGCGTAANQYISVSDSGTVSIMEYNDQQGWMACTVTSAGGASAIKPSSCVTWQTYSSTGPRTWHHQGKAVAAYPGHPNRS